MDGTELTLVDAATRRLGLVKPPSEYDHTAMRNTIARPLFTRMWTVQEAAMAGQPFCCAQQTGKCH
jgi:hypothetical protein